MLNGQPRPRGQFFLDGSTTCRCSSIGDGLLPADIDGKQKPMTDTAIPMVGTQDDDCGLRGDVDALNIWDCA